MMLLDLLKTTANLFKTVHPGGSKRCAIVNHVDYEGFPVTVCPDVHGRPELVRKALAGPGPVIFVGDIIHREDNEVWKRIHMQSGPLHERPEFLSEVGVNLTCWKLILQAKEKDPNRVHFVRGNHDDTEGVLMGQYSKGYFSSCTWSEGLQALNSAFYRRMVEFERSIPYIYCGFYNDGKVSPDIIVTHSFPHSPTWADTPKLNHPETHDTYSWSDNTGYNADWDRYPNPSLHALMDQTFASTWNTLDHWFVGHRPVTDGLARVQKDGKVVQVNNQKQHVLLTYNPAEQGQKWQANLV